MNINLFNIVFLLFCFCLSLFIVMMFLQKALWESGKVNYEEDSFDHGLDKVIL